MVSTKEVRKALYTKLNVAPITTKLATGSASLFHAVAPATTDQYPFLVYAKQSGTPRHSIGTLELDDQVWLVKCVARDKSSSVAEDVAAAVHAALDFQTLTISGGTNLYLARESDVDFVEVEGDTQYRHHGALYRVVVT